MTPRNCAAVAAQFDADFTVELCHVFEAASREAFYLGESGSNVSRKRVYVFVAPFGVGIELGTDIPVHPDELGVGALRRTNSRSFDDIDNALERIFIVVRVYQHGYTSISPDMSLGSSRSRASRAATICCSRSSIPLSIGRTAASNLDSVFSSGVTTSAL